MNGTPFTPLALDLSLDTPEVALLAWPIAAVLGVLVIVDYIRRGHRPARRSDRAVLILAVLGAAAVSFVLLGGQARDLLRTWPALVAGGLALAWTLGSYRVTTSPVPRWVRGACTGLRLAAVASLTLLLARPALETQRVRIERPRLAVLLDGSRSMAIRDVTTEKPGGLQSRIDALNNAIAANWQRFEKLKKSFDLTGIGFGETPSPIVAEDGDPWSVVADGQATDIGRALQALAEEAAGADAPLGAIVLVSDGADNLSTRLSAAAAAEGLAGTGIPLLAVGVGSERPRGDTRMLIARDLRLPIEAAVGAQLPIAAEFESLGLANTDIRIEVLWDDVIVVRKKVRPSGDVEMVRVECEHVARPAGFHTVEVRATPQDPNWRDGPVSLSKFVRVTEDKINILYVEAKLRSESAFIARALAGEERFRLTKVVLSRPLEGTWENVLPRSADDWKSYHVILLGDLQRGDLTNRQIPIVRDAVSENGTGLGIVGGMENTGSKGLTATDLADVLPVNLGGGLIEGSVRLQPTAAGLRHAICQIADVGTLGEIWARLPSMSGASKLGEPKPTAEVLLVDQDARPMLVVGTVGRGRTMVLAADSTWRWVMSAEGGADWHRRFWRQMVFWLANRRPLVQIVTDQPRYDLLNVRPGGKGVDVQAFVIDGFTGLPVTTAQLDARLVDAGGAESRLSLVATEDRWTARVFPEAAGEYRLRLSATDEGVVLGESEARFVVETVDLERRTPLANLALLRQLAATTSQVGGRYADLDQLGLVLDSLAAGNFRRERVEIVRRDIAADFRWPALLVFCSLLTLEWIVRKRTGLI